MENNKLAPKDKATELVEQYQNHLDSDPKYSLEVDPENKYNLSDQAKALIKFYVDTKSIVVAADYAGMEVDDAKKIFVSYPFQQEVRRINLALYHRQFASKMLTLDEIGGYLTCLITDEGVPTRKQLETKDKLKVIDQLIELNKLKTGALNDPRLVISKDIEIELKSLSVKTINQLLDADKPKDIIQTIDNQNLSPEEKAYLSTLPTKDLLQLIDETNKGGTKNDDKIVRQMQETD